MGRKKYNEYGTPNDKKRGCYDFTKDILLPLVGFILGSGTLIILFQPQFVTQIFLGNSPVTETITTPVPSATTVSTHTPETIFSGTIEVNAAELWASTGIFVETGDILIIEYQSGVWSGRNTDGASSFVRPGGNGPAQEFPCVPIAQHGTSGTGPNALIGRIGINGELFRILTYTNPDYFSSVMNVSGELYLQMNDCTEHFYDNEGIISVHIEVRRADNS